MVKFVIILMFLKNLILDSGLVWNLYLGKNLFNRLGVKVIFSIVVGFILVDLKL